MFMKMDLVNMIRVLDVQPVLEAYEVGVFALTKRLSEPLIEAFWHQRELGRGMH